MVVAQFVGQLIFKEKEKDYTVSVISFCQQETLKGGVSVLYQRHLPRSESHMRQSISEMNGQLWIHVSGCVLARMVSHIAESLVSARQGKNKYSEICGLERAQPFPGFLVATRTIWR